MTGRNLPIISYILIMPPKSEELTGVQSEVLNESFEMQNAGLQMKLQVPPQLYSPTSMHVKQLLMYMPFLSLL